MAYTRESIEQVKNAADILDVIQDYIEVRRTGANFMARCPFHNEKTPSFSILPERNYFHCFGCHKAGDAFTFVMEYKKLGYIEAVELLAKKYNIRLIDDSKKSSPEQIRKDEIYRALDLACYHFQMQMELDKTKLAYRFFTDRGFTSETMKEFRLGYSNDSWEDVFKHLQANNVNADIIEDAGLVLISQKSNKYVDRFRGRAMFPIRDIIGRVIAFGARDLSNRAKEAKYINSPETPVYHKGKVLFGLYEAKQAIREHKFAIMTEGYADVITLHQAGIKNVVASSGTALTPEQLKLLGQFSKDIVFVFDGDGAGQKATSRGIELALSQGFNIGIVTLPEGEDPDSIVKNRGKQSFELFLAKKINFVSFKIDTFKKSGLFAEPATKSSSIRDVIDLIVSIPDKLQHDYYLTELAEHSLQSLTNIRDVYQEKREKYAFKEKKEQVDSFSHITKKEVEDRNKDYERYLAQLTNGIDFIEFVLIKYCLKSYSNLHTLFDVYEFDTDMCSSPKGKEILMKISMIQDSGHNNVMRDIEDSTELEEIDKRIIKDFATINVINISRLTDAESAVQSGISIWADYNFEEAIPDIMKQLQIRKIEKKKAELEIEGKKENITKDEFININKQIIDLKESIIKLKGISYEEVES
jgi:DNA primase catalytic core